MAWTLIANTADTDTSGTVTTDAINTTGADLIVISVSRFNTPTVSDSAGNTWTALTEATLGGHPEVRLYYCLNPTTSATHTFTAAAANAFAGISVQAWSGADSYNSQQSGTGTAAGTSLQPGSITPSADGCLIISGFGYGGTSTISINSGFNITNQLPLDSGNAYGTAIAYLDQTTAAAVNPTWSWTGSTSANAVMAVFAPAAGGGGGGSSTVGSVSAAATAFAISNKIVNVVGNAAGSATSAASSQSSGTITLTDVTDRKIIQRQSGVGSLTVAGSYTGTPTSIQARVVNHGTSTEALTWTTIVASPAGGTFSGTLSNIPEGGWYNVQVRFSNNTTVTSNGSNKFGVGALVAVYGQSNGPKWFNTGATTAPDTAGVWNGTTFASLGASAQGAVGFAEHFRATDAVPVGFFNSGVDAAAVASLDGAGTTTNIDNLLTAVSNSGDKLEAVVWIHGETDAGTGTTQTSYEDDFYNDADSVVKHIRANVTNASGQSNLPFLVVLLGRYGGGNGIDTGIETIKAAQINVINTGANVYMAAQTHDVEHADEWHYIGASYATIAKRCAQTLLYINGDATYHRGPAVASATLVDATHVDVNLTHRGGTNISPATGIRGFEVKDNGVWSAATTAVAQTSASVRLTVSALTNLQDVRVFYGADGGVAAYANAFTGALVDNTALALPVEYTATTTITGPQGTSTGTATASGVAIKIANAVGSSTGASSADGVNDQVVVTQRAAIMGDAGGELTWEDHVKEVHRLRMLEGQIREQKKELRKVVKKIKTAEKQYKAEKAEGILATYLELEFKKEEIETKIQALEVDLTPLIISARKAEIEEDDAEFFSLLK
jgi:hypothetical protein